MLASSVMVPDLPAAPGDRRHWQIGDWRVDPDSGEIEGARGRARLEPKLLDLLRLLVEADGGVVSHEQLLQALWPGMIVGEDTLARSVSRLRRALGDSAKSPEYIETLPKRGYRLVAAVQRALLPRETDAAAPAPRPAPATGRRWWPLALAMGVLASLAWLAWPEVPEPAAIAPAPEAAMLARADDHYAQYQYPDNEAALQLYERVLTLRPDHPPALAGLANALVQKAMRWPDGAGGDREFERLGDALAAGHLREPAQARLLSRARGLAERAWQLDPELTIAWRAYGLAASAQGDFDTALDAYRNALARDPQAWGVQINLADLLEISGQPEQALPHFESAFAAMQQAYASEPARVRGWDAALGVLIGDRYLVRGDAAGAETWYRRVLAIAPSHPAASRALIALLRDQGADGEAERLCRSLQGVGESCAGGDSE